MKCLSDDQFLQDAFEAISYRPIGIMTAELGQIADVTDVVPFAILIMVDAVDLPPG